MTGQRRKSILKLYLVQCLFDEVRATLFFHLSGIGSLLKDKGTRLAFGKVLTLIRSLTTFPDVFFWE